MTSQLGILSVSIDEGCGRDVCADDVVCFLSRLTSSPKKKLFLALLTLFSDVGGSYISSDELKSQCHPTCFARLGTFFTYEKYAIFLIVVKSELYLLPSLLLAIRKH